MLTTFHIFAKLYEKATRYFTWKARIKQTWQK